MRSIRALAVASEIYPIIKTGGLADVVDALPVALNAALRCGAVAIVSRVGGLADTVIDADEAAIASGKATGVQFGPVTVENLAGAIRRAGALFNDKPVWRSIQKKGMTVDVSWRNSARRYADLYRQIVKTRANSS